MIYEIKTTPILFWVKIITIFCRRWSSHAFLFYLAFTGHSLCCDFSPWNNGLLWRGHNWLGECFSWILVVPGNVIKITSKNSYSFGWLIQVIVKWKQIMLVLSWFLSFLRLFFIKTIQEISPYLSLSVSIVFFSFLCFLLFLWFSYFAHVLQIFCTCVTVYVLQILLPVCTTCPHKVMTFYPPILKVAMYKTLWF